MTSLRQPRDNAQATTSTVAETKAGAAQLGWARDRKLTARSIANTGNAKEASRRARGSARGRGEAGRTGRAAKNSGAQTPEFEPKEFGKGPGGMCGALIHT